MLPRYGPAPSIVTMLRPLNGPPWDCDGFKCCYIVQQMLRKCAYFPLPVANKSTKRSLEAILLTFAQQCKDEVPDRCCRRSTCIVTVPVGDAAGSYILNDKIRQVVSVFTGLPSGTSGAPANQGITMGKGKLVISFSSGRKPFLAFLFIPLSGTFYRDDGTISRKKREFCCMSIHLRPADI